ncbi:MAG: pyridoxamine 5'-phosphate oxidase family protein [Ignavibacteria bacterium]|jgi:nitroimidazol reductase NimA-like FMN-containing flavoprotein (pyridoxamine 5'-phosphate oxidase superfamily)|nr:pyridoxamine 5'-phosphate oxidase family protein [Ignavibacteria bacterium]MBK6875481.1 pyridoxamine 5'-phosphate oxidase family protein [Ignavibacteria bacterium]
MTEAQTEVKDRILEILKNNDAIMIASTGGEYSPWILGAYFASKDIDIYVLLETHGKTFANLKENSKVAVSISKNDAMQDFLQAQAEVEVLPDTDEPEVRKLIVDKMPWFQTYTPVSPVRIRVKKYFVTSLQKGWFPAKVLEN